MNKTDEQKLLEKRYNSLINRSFDLLLRYRLYQNFSTIPNVNVNDSIYEINDETKKEFASLYDADKRDILLAVNKVAKDFQKNNKDFIRAYKRNYKKNFFMKQMPLETFKKIWQTKDERHCAYCGIKETQISSLNIQTKRFYSRGKTMEIDKINPNGNYVSDNIVLSCYWCNNAKSDEFTHDEFTKIAKTISSVWEQRLTKPTP